jgi:hypothetical protein
VLLFLIGVVLSFIQQVRMSTQEQQAEVKAHEKEIRDQGDIKYTQGQLDSINKMLANVISSHASDSQDLTKDLLRGIMAASHGADHKDQMTDAQLCSRTTDLANKIRVFETDFSKSEESERDKWIRELSGATGAERQSLERNSFQQERQRSKDHEEKFVNDFLSDVKYDHDQIIDRLSAPQRDQLVGHNGQEEASISVGQLVGWETGYRFASYLDQLAKALCSK